MDKEGQTMPSFDSLTKEAYTPKQWLTYYRNIWTRNLMGSTCDVAHDAAIVQLDPKAQTAELVPDGKGGARNLTYAERLEDRKAHAKTAIGIIATIDELLALDDAELAERLTADSPTLQPAAPAVESALKAYIVQPGKTVTKDGAEEAEGAKLMLDPSDQQTIDWLGEGAIALETAPDAA